MKQRKIFSTKRRRFDGKALAVGIVLALISGASFAAGVHVGSEFGTSEAVGPMALAAEAVSFDF